MRATISEAPRMAPPERAGTAAVARPGGWPELRRMRFFRDLLAQGYRSALAPGLDATTLRAERIALGLDLPELDAVACWSIRRADGTVSIPFIEFILGRMIASLDAFVLAMRERRTGGPLSEARCALGRALRRAGRGSGGSLTVPRLSDAFLPEPFVAALCGPGGLLDGIVEKCEALASPAGRALRRGAAAFRMGRPDPVPVFLGAHRRPCRPPSRSRARAAGSSRRPRPPGERRGPS